MALTQTQQQLLVDTLTAVSAITVTLDGGIVDGAKAFMAGSLAIRDELVALKGEPNLGTLLAMLRPENKNPERVHAIDEPELMQLLGDAQQVLERECTSIERQRWRAMVLAVAMRTAEASGGKLLSMKGTVNAKEAAFIERLTVALAQMV